MNPAFIFDSCYTTGFRKSCDTTCGGIAIEKRLKTSGISLESRLVLSPTYLHFGLSFDTVDLSLGCSCGG